MKLTEKISQISCKFINFFSFKDMAKRIKIQALDWENITPNISDEVLEKYAEPLKLNIKTKNPVKNELTSRHSSDKIHG